ncbi:MAG: NAD(P)H-dependent oxidoreductase [Rhodospirillaceae bacterium]
MGQRIAILQGHPDPAGGHLCHALAAAYADGAKAAGHHVKIIDVATLEFPLLRTQEDYKTGTTPVGLVEAQGQILDAEHLVIIYPLWLGTLPAILKGFLEQVLRPSLAASSPGEQPSYSEFSRLMKGTSCRVIITMGMPALAYRFFFFAHSLKNLERNILKFVGVKPIRTSLFGMVDTASAEKRQLWLAAMKMLGKRAG